MKITVILVLLCVQSAALAVSYPAFTLLDSSYQNHQSVVTAPNMPPVKSQDGLGICYGFAAWTVFAQRKCVHLNKDCQSMAPNELPSPLYLASLGAANRGDAQEDFPEIVPYGTGGSSVTVLGAFKRSGASYADSCYPFDQFVSHHRNDAASTNAAFERLRQEFDLNKTVGSACTDCLIKNLNEDFNLRKDSTTVNKALAQDSFDKFLFDIFLKDCPDALEASPSFGFKGWPSDGKISYDGTINKVREVLKDGHPLLVQACVGEKISGGMPSSCNTAHEFVISGYRKSCKPDGTCRDTVKITNSWGQDWQDENNDGWVDARTLYEYMGKGKNALAWITE